MKNMKKEIWKMSNIEDKDKYKMIHLFILLIFISEINNLIKLNYIVR